jgi:hypothetical protein
MSFNPLTTKFSQITPDKSLTWKDGKVPEDHHICGFNNDLCVTSSYGFRLPFIAATVICIVVVAVATIRHEIQVKVMA